VGATGTTGRSDLNFMPTKAPVGTFGRSCIIGVGEGLSSPVRVNVINWTRSQDCGRITRAGSAAESNSLA
jgi:hypothetical protein